MASSPRRTALWLEMSLWLFAGVSSAVLINQAVAARAAQQDAAEIIPRVHAPATASDGDTSVPRSGELIARLEIGHLLSVPVLENDDAATLKRGVGHLPGTAVPGGLGNMVLAGHRDTFFRPLAHVKAGAVAEMITPGGRYRYLVDSTEIVMPEQVSVTAIGDRPEMTLVTCYPFDFIGAAPKRYIVHAHLLSVDPV